MELRDPFSFFFLFSWALWGLLLVMGLIWQPIFFPEPTDVFQVLNSVLFYYNYNIFYYYENSYFILGVLI